MTLELPNLLAGFPTVCGDFARSDAYRSMIFPLVAE